MIVRIKELTRFLLVEIPDKIAIKVESYQMELDEMLSAYTGPLYFYFDSDPSKGISYGAEEFLRWISEEYLEPHEKAYIVSIFEEPINDKDRIKIKKHRRKPIIYI